jgi:hypothetical protein
LVSAVAAAAVRAALLDEEMMAPRYTDTCWGRLDGNDCVKFVAGYAPVNKRIAEVRGSLPKLEDSDARRRANSMDRAHWYKSITQDMFGDA